MNRLNSNKGLTLIEIIIALAILGIISTIIVGYYRSAMKVNQDVKTQIKSQTYVTSVMNAIEQEIKEANIPVLDKINGSKYENASNIFDYNYYNKGFSIISKANSSINQNLLSNVNKAWVVRKPNGESSVILLDTANEKVVIIKVGENTEAPDTWKIISNHEYRGIKDIEIGEKADENGNMTGANIKVIGIGDEYTLSNTYYTRNTVSYETVIAPAKYQVTIDLITPYGDITEYLTKTVGEEVVYDTQMTGSGTINANVTTTQVGNNIKFIMPEYDVEITADYTT